MNKRDLRDTFYYLSGCLYTLFGLMDDRLLNGEQVQTSFSGVVQLLAKQNGANNIRLILMQLDETYRQIGEAAMALVVDRIRKTMD
jgi:hypothetical protein